MSLEFRNVDASPTDPVETWPLEAVVTVLERGGLADWRRLAEAIRRDPWGQVARYVEEAVELSHPYGVSELMIDAIAAARAAAEQSERDEVAGTVHRLLAASGLTRTRFAAAIGTSPSRLSTYLSGTVAPSSTLLVRMGRVAEAAHAAPVPRRTNTRHPPLEGTRRIVQTTQQPGAAASTLTTPEARRH